MTKPIVRLDRVRSGIFLAVERLQDWFCATKFLWGNDEIAADAGSASSRGPPCD